MRIKVLSYNIHKGFDTFGLKFTLHQLKETLEATQADILLLQEVVGENTKHQSKILSWPAQAQFEYLADRMWPHYSYGKNAVFSYRHHGNALLSRFPIVFQENINISTNRMESRGLLHCILQIPPLNNRHLHIFNVHLNLRAAGRKIQLEKIIQRFKDHVPLETPFILGGDFNDWTKAATPILMQHLGLYEAHLELHKRHAKSFPSFIPLMTLDRLYYKHITPKEAKTLTQSPWSKLSDHLPLFCEFEILETTI